MRGFDIEETILAGSIENRINTLLAYDDGTHYELPLFPEEEAEVFALSELLSIAERTKVRSAIKS